MTFILDKLLNQIRYSMLYKQWNTLRPNNNDPILFIQRETKRETERPTICCAKQRSFLIKLPKCSCVKPKHVAELWKCGFGRSIISVSNVYMKSNLFFLWRFDPIPRHGLPLRGFAITLRHTHTHTQHTHTQSVWHLCASDQPDAETSTWQHTSLPRDRYPCPRRD
jgi:hypothetical protein